MLTLDANPLPPAATAVTWLDCAAASGLDPPPTIAHATLTLPCGGTYVGDALDGAVPHGDGTLTRPNGDTYRGRWRRGMQSGRGVATFARGEAYDGEWEDGAPHG